VCGDDTVTDMGVFSQNTTPAVVSNAIKSTRYRDAVAIGVQWSAGGRPVDCAWHRWAAPSGAAPVRGS
jgi:hypothetical protein